MKQKLTCCDAGYRRLKPGDRIFDGDEYWCGHPDAGFWAFTGDVGRKLGCNDLVYRRRDPVYRERILVCDDCACDAATAKAWVGKVIHTVATEQVKTNPGPAPEYGWRLLRPGEIVVDGDRESFVENSWHPVDDTGPRNITVKHGRFERRIEPGEGYRLLMRGETIVEGDEIRSTMDGSWRETILVGHIVQDAVFRRKLTMIEPGVGYRLLTVGEKIEAGDELYDDGAWTPRNYSIGDKFEKGMLATRRKIAVDPGVGYRLLAFGEVIELGDEYYSESSNSWCPRGLYVGSVYEKFHVTTRRKIAVDPGAGYRLLKLGERLEPDDEWLYQGIWNRANQTGVYDNSATEGVRRRIVTTEKSYRLLRVGEIVRLTDEVYNLVKVEWDSVANHTYLKVVTENITPVRREMELAYVGGPA